jgi:SpoVK/Ycf46/Vps4 family AAA+-type ATPase
MLQAAVVQLFKEIRRQTPSVIFIPDIDIWYDTVPETTLRIFKQHRRSG